MYEECHNRDIRYKQPIYDISTRACVKVCTKIALIDIPCKII